MACPYALEAQPRDCPPCMSVMNVTGCKRTCQQKLNKNNGLFALSIIEATQQPGLVRLCRLIPVDPGSPTIASSFPFAAEANDCGCRCR